MDTVRQSSHQCPLINMVKTGISFVGTSIHYGHAIMDVGLDISVVYNVVALCLKCPIKYNSILFLFMYSKNNSRKI